MSDHERRSLELALADPDLLALVPPVVAAGFGVLPLEAHGSVLTVACLPHANPVGLALLRPVLEREIVATPFTERALRQAIRQAYLPDDRSINFPTFREADFLEDPASAPILGQEKVERLGPVEQALPADALVLATLTYGTVLSDADAPAPAHGGPLPDPRRTKLELRDLDTAGWRRDPAGRVHLHLPAAAGALDARSRLVLTEFRHSEYRHLAPGARVGEHETRSTVVADLPHVIHATEVQVVGLGADGALVLHAYDERLTCPPGAERRVELTYYFLSFGSRLQRRIQVDVHDVVRVARDDVTVHAGPAPWGPTELARWLGVAPGPTARSAREE